MNKPKLPESPPTVLMKLNEHDIYFVECPKCQTYYPNAMPGLITCFKCNFQFSVKEK